MSSQPCLEPMSTHSSQNNTSLSFELVIRQQPVRSRMCGIGERVDRRPIDPPPIVELKLKRKNDENKNLLQLRSPYLFLAAILIPTNATESDDDSLSLEFHSRLTVGRSVSSLYLLRDLDNTEGAFFVFSEMSVRAEGTYRLRMSLFDMERESITTDEFSVYSAKKFPGMYESCPLARSFADQGLKIRIRKESKTRKRESARKATTNSNSHNNSSSSSNSKKAHSEAIVSNEPYESICMFEDDEDSQDEESADNESDQCDTAENQNYYDEMMLTTTRSSISNQSVTTACSYPDEYMGAPVHNDDCSLPIPTRDNLIHMDTDPIEKHQHYKHSTPLLSSSTPDHSSSGQYTVSSLISGLGISNQDCLANQNTTNQQLYETKRKYSPTALTDQSYKKLSLANLIHPEHSTLSTPSPTSTGLSNQRVHYHHQHEIGSSNAPFTMLPPITHRQPQSQSPLNKEDNGSRSIGNVNLHTNWNQQNDAPYSFINMQHSRANGNLIPLSPQNLAQGRRVSLGARPDRPEIILNANEQNVRQHAQALPSLREQLPEQLQNYGIQQDSHEKS